MIFPHISVELTAFATASPTSRGCTNSRREFNSRLKSTGSKLPPTSGGGEGNPENGPIKVRLPDEIFAFRLVTCVDTRWLNRVRQGARWRQMLRMSKDANRRSKYDLTWFREAVYCIKKVLGTPYIDLPSPFWIVLAPQHINDECQVNDHIPVVNR